VFFHIKPDNTKRRAGGLEGRVANRRNMNFPRACELHRRAGRHAAPQDGPVGCTLRLTGGLHIQLGCGKGRAGGPFSAARRKFTFFIWKHGPPARRSSN